MSDDIWDDEKYNPVQILEGLVKGQDTLIKSKEGHISRVVAELNDAKNILKQNKIFLNYLINLIEDSELSYLEESVYRLINTIDAFLST